AVIATLFVHCLAVAGEPPEGPGKAAEKFYAEYLVLVNANKATTPWIAKSKLVTAAFKKYYAKEMSPKNGDPVESDPVLQAQDVPTSPFKAGKVVIKENKATVSLSAKFDNDTDNVSVQMVLKDGVWLVDMVRAGK
ncbi:MAG: hypothetical protein WCD79_21450, partial [Chthoniobacteraceae bacterium]